MVYPNADKITYKYDIRRLLESVTNERGKITSYEFDPQYRLKKITDPLNHTKQFGYDDMSNIARGTRGTADVFHNGAGIGVRSTWGTVEYPILAGNNVTITYQVVFP